MKNFSLLRMQNFILAAIAVLCIAVIGFAQTDSARIQGTVTDANGAIVKGASVTIKSVGTGREIKTTTDDEGNYTAVGLQPGRYAIEVGLANFKTTKQEVALDVAQNAVLNFSLAAGAVTETVNVTTDVQQIETSTSAIGSVVRGRQIVELPLNGRSVIELARLTPGVTQGVVGGFATGAGGDAETYRGGNTGGAALSVNGQRTQANNFLLDGVDNNESLVNTINIFPSADAVQEFRVQTSVATAEFGRGGGAIINSVTKSGTTAFHGSSYLFVRNSVLDARPAFDTTKNLFRRGQYGGTIGGPVWLGDNGLKNKIFFFASYEGLRQFLPRYNETASVPTAAFRTGNFSALGTQLRDPLNGQNICVTGTTTNGNLCVNGDGVAYNRLDLLPGNRLNAAGLKYLAAYPSANNGSQFQNNYATHRDEIDHQDVFDFRVDANITSTSQVFVRGNWGKYSQTLTSRLPALPAGYGSGSNPWSTKGLVAGWNWSATPTMFNELRVQANKLRYGYEPPFGDQALAAGLGIVNANRDPSLGGGALIGGYNGQLEYTGDYGPTVFRRRRCNWLTA